MQKLTVYFDQMQGYTNYSLWFCKIGEFWPNSKLISEHIIWKTFSRAIERMF